MQSLQTLERLIADHRLQSQAKHDRVTAEWLTAKCDAMCLKVRVLQNQMIRDTYTPEATEALKRIKYVNVTPVLHVGSVLAFVFSLLVF